MKIYFVDNSQKGSELGGARRFLVSYAIWKNCKKILKKYIEDGYDIFLDSGAFQIYSRNETIKIEDYMDFIKSLNFKLYANLDIIGDAEKTLENQKIMEDHNFTPIPVFHIGEDFKYLEYYLQRYSYIGLGGIAGGGSKRKNENFLNRCFYMIKDYWPVKIHGFGVADQKLLERFPFYSVDTSTPSRGGGLGQIIFFEKGKIQHKRQQDKDIIFKFLDLIDDVIFPGFLGNRRTIHNTREFLKLESYITELWKQKGVEWSD